MSASKDKINRKELRESGQDKRQLAEAKKAAEDRRDRRQIFNRIYCILFLCLIQYRIFRHF